MRHTPPTFMASVFFSLRQSLNGLLVLIPVLIGLAVISPAQAAQWDAETLTVPADLTVLGMSGELLAAWREVSAAGFF